MAALAAAHGADAWRLALVAGVDQAAATRAAVHALVIAAVEGGAAAERPAILALARSWALSSAAPAAAPPGEGPVVGAFWSLAEPLRSALWCTDGLGLAATGVERVLGPAHKAGRASVARGRLRRDVCRQWRAAEEGTGCAPAADAALRVFSGRAPAAERALVDDHAAGCDRCAPVLSFLREPVDAVGAGLPPAPDLAAPARAAWRDHVGAARRSPAEQVRHAAAVTGRRRRPVTAVLALVSAGIFAAATSQLAASAPGPVAEATLTAPGLPVSPRTPPPPVLRRQAVIPPLAPEVALDPRLVPLLAPGLLEVTPAVLPPPPPAAATPAPAPAPALVAEPVPLLVTEPPPAVEQSSAIDITLPLPVPVPFSIDIDPACPSIQVGWLRLALPCER